ncbi:MAG: hypothetical protein JRI68_23975 [Deltaproteobacteria bacterium]|nr:hypothetical protein [Deltaproteobacteria bacterium]
MASPEDELKAQGWSQRTTYDEPRLSEMVALYEELGFEVRLEPFCPMDDQCSECLMQEPGRFKTIYVRNKGRRA